MKKKNKKILIGSLATLLILGGASALIGVASDGFKNWDTKTWFKDEFHDVKIESKTFIFDGTKKELEIIVPENATYTVVIKKGTEIVNECIEIGVYNYEITVKIGEKTKIFKADLTIAEATSELAFSKTTNIRKAKVNTSTYELEATITPSYASNKNIDWSIKFLNPSSTWANNKNVEEYVSITPNRNKCIVTLIKRFNEKIEVNASTTDGTNIKASCTIDCVKHVSSISSTYSNKCDLINSFNGSYGDGMAFDIYQLFKVESDGLPYTWDKLINVTPLFTEGTIDYSGSSNVTYSLDNSNYDLSQSISDILEGFIEINETQVLISQGKLTNEKYSGLADLIINEGEGSDTKYIPFIDVNIEAYGKTNSFPIYMTCSKFDAVDIELNEGNIIFE